MREIVLGFMIAVILSVGACQGGADAAAAVAKIQELYAKRAQIADGWLGVMEQNAADPAAGLQKGAEFVSTNVPVFIGMATELCNIIRANQRSSAVRDAFQKVNEEVKTGMEVWKIKANAVDEKYPGFGQDLGSQYTSLNSAFFETAKSCMPE